MSLFVWLMLLTVAVSGFAFNLPKAYAAMMKRVTNFEDIDARPDLDQPLAKPAVGWTQALELGQRYMSEAAAEHGFTINHPWALIYRRENGNYFYRVHSSRDLVRYGTTSVGINASTGELIGVELPTGQRWANTFTSWIMALHMADVFGLPWQIFMTFLGVTVSLLSISGVLIWWRKRGRARAAGRPTGRQHADGTGPGRCGRSPALRATRREPGPARCRALRQLPRHRRRRLRGRCPRGCWRAW